MLGVLAIAASSLVGVPAAAAASTAASPDDRWEPVADECVVALNSKPVGEIHAGYDDDPAGTVRRDVQVSMVADERCGAVSIVTNWSWDVLAAVRHHIPSGDGTNPFDRHGEIISAPDRALPIPACGRVADLTQVENKPYYWVEAERPVPLLAYAAFDISLARYCSSSTVLVAPDLGGPAFAAGNCFIALTSAYNRPSVVDGVTTAIVRVSTNEACDGPLEVTGASIDSAVSTDGATALTQTLQCDGTTRQKITVSTTESSRKSTSGVVKERFDLVVDGDCEPHIANREALVWSAGGRVDCRQTVANLQAAESVDDMVCAADFADADSDTLRLYRAFFAREPDVAGAKYWLSVTRDGATADDLSYGFSESREFVDTYGDLGDEEFLTLLYRNMLGRTPDPAGFSYWRDQMTIRRLPRHLVVRWVVANAEFASRFPYES